MRHGASRRDSTFYYLHLRSRGPQAACILAAFKDFPYFLHFCKNRTWRPSGKPQCSAAFILASFKTAQYPCGFAHTRRPQKHPLFAAQPHRTWRPSAKTQCFAIFNLAAFKTAQYPCTFARARPPHKRRTSVPSVAKTSPPSAQLDSLFSRSTLSHRNCRRPPGNCLTVVDSRPLPR